MSNSVQSERSSDRSTETDPTLAELMDPAALERRLTDARRRREEALRAREERLASGEAPPERKGFGLPPRPVALPSDERDFGRRDAMPTPEAPAPSGASWQAPAIPAAPRAAPDSAFSRQEPSARPPLSPLGQAAEIPEAGARASAPDTQARPGWTRPVSTPPRSILAEQSAAARAKVAEEKATSQPTTEISPGWGKPPPPISEPGTPAETETYVPPITPPLEGPIGKPTSAKRDRTPTALPVMWISIFLIGLLGGGLAVLFAPPSFRAWVAEAINPPASTPAAPEVAEAPAETNGPTPSVPEATPEMTAEAPEVVTTVPDAPRLATAGPAAAPPLDGATSLPAIDPPGPGPAPTAPDALVQADPAGPPPPVTAPAVDVATATAPSVAPPVAPAETAPAPVETAETAPPEAPAAADLLNSARISLNYPTTAARTATELAAALRAAGAGEANVVPVGFSVSATNIRYYHSEDRAAAEAVATLVGATGPVETRDFTNFRPSPLPGIIEVWLSGQSAAAPPRPTTPPAQSAPTATTRPGRDLQAEEVERLLLSREVERMLRQGAETTQ
jgi:hypothetical protein